MTENEMELIRLIRESKDPAKAMVAAVEIICQFLLDQKEQAAPIDNCDNTDYCNNTQQVSERR